MVLGPISNKDYDKGAKRSEADRGRENYVSLLTSMEFDLLFLTAMESHQLYLLTLDNELCLAPFGTPHVRLPTTLYQFSNLYRYSKG